MISLFLFTNFLLHLCTLHNLLHPSIPHTAVVLSLYLYLLHGRYLVDHFGYCLSVFDPKGAAQQAQTAIKSHF
jgi:hypothetical protein